MNELEFDMDYVEEWCARLGLDLIFRRIFMRSFKWVTVFLSGKKVIC